MNKKLQQICAAFRICGTFLSCEEIRIGNVNRTYRVNYLNDEGVEKSYIVQKVNTYVFPNAVQVMDNIDSVTEHIRAKKPDSIALHFHHTQDRKTYVLDQSDFWRLFNYIPSTTYNICDDPQIIRNAGEAFGEFQMLLSDFDAGKLFETIPDFHNTRKRFEKLWEDAKADPCHKAAEVRSELEWLKSVQDTACTLTDMYARGELPLRVTHNDTKINNVLFEKNGKKALAVVDLDTVMPGLVGHDFGDAIRFAANYVEEDSDEFDRAGVNMDIFRAFTEGFLKHTADALTRAEIDTLALSCFVLAAELASRFLDDYILGNLYFKISHPRHNLVRARCQIALAKDMLKKLPEMRAVVQQCMAENARNCPGLRA